MWGRKAAPRDSEGAERPLDDTALLALFQTDTGAAWDLFLERYANRIFGQLRGMGFDYDAAMDRFVYICDKLAEEDCRRLRGVRFAGQRGELVPWVRTVVNSLCVSWAWSQDGRKRLFKQIERLSKLDQRVFELYFWAGLTPDAVRSQLAREAVFDVRGTVVFDALERVISSLSANQLWRLASGLLRARRVTSFEELSELAGVPVEPVEPRDDPETLAMAREEADWLARGLETLDARPRLALQLRFEEALTLAEIGRALSLTERQVKTMIRRSLEALRALRPQVGAGRLAEGGNR